LTIVKFGLLGGLKDSQSKRSGEKVGESHALIAIRTGCSLEGKPFGGGWGRWTRQANSAPDWLTPIGHLEMEPVRGTHRKVWLPEPEGEDSGISPKYSASGRM
jgi:hypothetical protein